MNHINANTAGTNAKNLLESVTKYQYLILLALEKNVPTTILTVAMLLADELKYLRLPIRRLTINERYFISGVVFYMPLEGLATIASDGPDPQDPGSPAHHKALAVS